MADPAKTQLQSMLQAAVHSVGWTYSLFWKFCLQQGILVWEEGYYNGAIKTRKTVQPMEVAAQEATTLHRSQQLRELYDSLSSGEPSHHHTRRPSAALSPEDLTESEWFYLMCASFSFPPGFGLPGKAYVMRQHMWLTRANEADAKIFSRTILAKSAGIQTVVCIPLLDGVLELGTTQRVQEDNILIRRVKTFFSHDGQNPNSYPPRPVLSEHSTSGPPKPHLNSPISLQPMFPPMGNSRVAEGLEYAEEGVGSDSDLNHNHPMTEPLRFDACPDIIGFGSSDDGSSDHLRQDFDLLAVSRDSSPPENHLFDGGFAGSGFPLSITNLQPPQYSGSFENEMEREDSHYSRTIATIIETQSTHHHWSRECPNSTAASSFHRWSSHDAAAHNHGRSGGPSSQRALKYILLAVPLLHSPRSRQQSTTTSPAELNGGHVLVERRRREKLNERFVALRSLFPFVTKTDKYSILGDAIDYLKQLRKRIQELESQRDYSNGGGEGAGKTMIPAGGDRAAAAVVEVSIIEREALVEVQCGEKEGLLLELIQALSGLGVLVTAVQSSAGDGFFAAELGAKVKENMNGRRASIMEVKRAVHGIIYSQLII